MRRTRARAGAWCARRVGRPIRAGGSRIRERSSCRSRCRAAMRRDRSRSANDTPVVLDAAQRRFLDAITYYAALGGRPRAARGRGGARGGAARGGSARRTSCSRRCRTICARRSRRSRRSRRARRCRATSRAAAIEEQADRLTRMVERPARSLAPEGRRLRGAPELNTAEDLIGAAVRQTRGLFGDRPLRTVIDLDSPALVGHFDFSQSLRMLVQSARECGALFAAGRRRRARGASRWRQRWCSPSPIAARASATMTSRACSSRSIGAKNATPDAGRAGLGLSIARTLAEIQGGDVYVCAPARRWKRLLVAVAGDGTTRGRAGRGRADVFQRR